MGKCSDDHSQSYLPAFGFPSEFSVSHLRAHCFDFSARSSSVIVLFHFSLELCFQVKRFQGVQIKQQTDIFSSEL